MSVRRQHMDCEPTHCLVGDASPCILFQPIFRRVRVVSTPNPLYHGHEGDLIRYLSDLDGIIMAEVRWDKPWPTDHMSRQNVDVKYLVAVDGAPLDPSHLIQEEV